MANPPHQTRSLLGQLVNISLGTAFTAVNLADAGLTTVVAINRRVLTKVSAVAEPLRAPLDAIGATALVKRPVEQATARVSSALAELEIRGRTGLFLGDGATAQTVTGIINAVIEYLKDDPEIRSLVAAQVDWLLPALAENATVKDLVRAQVAAILPALAHDNEVQALIRAQAGQYIQYVNENPESVEPLVRTQGDVYIDYLNAHPTSVQNLVQGQSLSMASQVRDEVRERAVTADNLVDTLVRNLLRLRPREELPPPPENVQRRAQTARLPEDFIGEQPNASA